MKKGKKERNEGRKKEKKKGWWGTVGANKKEKGYFDLFHVTNRKFGGPTSTLQ